MGYLRLVAVAKTAFLAIAHAQTPANRPPAPATPAEIIAFVDVAVVPMDTERILPSQTVLVQHGRITALGPASKVKVPAHTVRIDGRGKYLIPGLNDMHVHLALYASFEGPDSIPSKKTQQEMLKFLAYGVTTIREMDMRRDAGVKALRLRNLVASGKALGPHIYTSGQWRMHLPDSVGGLFNECRSSKYDRPDNIAPQVEAYKAAGYDFIKVYGYDRDIFDSLMAAARRVGIPVAGHIPPGISLEHAMASGMKSFEHLLSYVDSDVATIVSRWGPDCIKAKYEPEMIPGGPTGEARLRVLAAATQRAGVWISPTLTLLGRSPEAMPFIKALQEAGAGLLASTDNGGGYGLGLHAELQAFVQAGLTPYQALVAATYNPAAYFGILDRSGTVAVGKRADLVLLHRNPLQDIAHTKQVAGVMRDGQWLDRTEFDQRLSASP